MNVLASAPFSADSSVYAQWTVESLVSVVLDPGHLTASVGYNGHTVIPSSLVVSVDTTTKWDPTGLTESALTSMYPTQQDAPHRQTHGKLAYPKQPESMNLMLKSTGTQVMTTQSYVSAPMMRPNGGSAIAIGKISWVRMLTMAYVSGSDSTRHSSIVNTRGAPHPYIVVGFAFSKIVFSTTVVGSPSFSQSSSSAAVAGLPSLGSTVTSSVMFGLVSSVLCRTVGCCSRWLWARRFRYSLWSILCPKRNMCKGSECKDEGAVLSRR